MTASRKTIIFLALALVITIGSLILGVRFGTNLLKKKFLATAEISKHLQIEWRTVNLNLLQSVATFEDVLFFEDKSPFLSVKKIRLRYSLIHFLRSGKFFFPDLRIEGLRRNCSLPLGGKASQIPPDNLYRTLLKANTIFKKIHLLDGEWKFNLPSINKKVYFQQIELKADLSSKDSLALLLFIPKIKVIGQDKENFSLPEAAIHLRQDSIKIDSFSLTTASGDEKISVQGNISHPVDASAAYLALLYEGQLNWKRLKRFYPGLSFHGSPLWTRGKIGGTVKNPILKGSIKVASLAYDHQGKEPLCCFPLLNLSSDYIFEKGKITLNRLFFSTLGGKISAQGNFFLPERKFSLTASADGLNLPPLPDQKLNRIQKAYPFSAGKLFFQGRILHNNQVVGAGEFDWQFHAQSKEDPLCWKAKFSLLGNKNIQFDSSVLNLAKNSLSFHGGLNFAKPESLKDVHFKVKIKNPQGLYALWPTLKQQKAGGELSFSGQIAGSFADPQLIGSLDWQKIAFRKFRAQKIEGTIRYHNRFIFLSRLHLQQNKSRVIVEGKISASTGRGTLRVVADPIYYDDLAHILRLHAPVLIKGKMVCKSTFEIMPKSQRKFWGSGQLTTGKCSITDQRHPYLKQHFEAITSKFEVDAHTFHLSQAIGSVGRYKILAELIIPHGHHSELDSFYSFCSEDWDLSHLDSLQTSSEGRVPLEGRASFHVQGRGGIGVGAWNWQVVVRQPKYKGFDPGQATLRVHMQGKDYAGKVNLGENKFLVQGKLDEEISYQLVGRVPKFKMEPDLSPKFSGKAEVELSGQLKLSGYLSDFINGFQQSKGEFSISQAVVHTPIHSFKARKPFIITYDKGLIFISESHFTGQGGLEATFIGEAVWNKRLDFSLSGNLPLAYLGKRYKFLSELKGNIQFSFSLKGPLDFPRFSGRLRVLDCSFDLQPGRLNRKIEAIRGDVFIDEHTITIANLSGKSNEGSFFLSGKLDWRDFEITSVNLNLRANNIILASPERYKFIINGDLNWQGNKEHSLVGGEIKVQEGVYHKDTGILKTLLTKRRKIEIDEKSLSSYQADSAWLNNASFNLKVNIPQNVWVKSTFFTAEIARSKFFIKGNFFSPYPDGQLQVTSGVILLGGNKFQIVSGLLDLGQTLDISAVADIDIYRITANIFGPIDDPQIRLSSMPYLSQSDILNMIALGLGSDGGPGLVGDIATATGSMLSDILGQESFSGIDLFRTKVLNRDLFRLDLFKFKVGEESGAVEKITLGRDITKRLQLKYSIPAPAAGEEKRKVAEAEYKLSDYIKLIGSQDDLGTYSLDLNFSFEF